MGELSELEIGLILSAGAVLCSIFGWALKRGNSRVDTLEDQASQDKVENAHRPTWTQVKAMTDNSIQNALNERELEQYKSGVLVAPVMQEKLMKAMIREEIHNAK